MEAANCLSYESQFGCLYEEEYRDFGEVVAAASLVIPRC